MRTADLTGIALDWAVAKALSLDVFIPAWADKPWLQLRGAKDTFCPNFSGDWSEGGPIIEREHISLSINMDGDWHATQWVGRLVSERHAVTYPKLSKPLIAAMRCYVASKLGDEVDVPKELIEALSQ
jgi:hypothetical protein